MGGGLIFTVPRVLKIDFFIDFFPTSLGNGSKRLSEWILDGSWTDLGRVRKIEGGLGSILGCLGRISEGSWRIPGSLLLPFLKDLCNFEQFEKIAKNLGTSIVFY